MTYDVVHVLASIDTRHGGPSRTVPALASAQADLGARVALVTLAPPADCPPLPAYSPRLELRAFPPAPGPAGRAFSASPGLASFLSSASIKAIHAHGLWLRPLHHAALAARRLGIPLVLGPRGMLEPWAAAHHSWKKRLAARFIHPGAAARVDGWHATSEQEADNLRRPPDWLRAPVAAPVCVASNGIAAPDPAAAGPARAAWLAAYPKLRDTRVALFYGRFHRKKRVAELLTLWGSRPRPGWTLLVAGIPGDYSVSDLAVMAGDSSASPVVVADGAPLPAPYPLADLFLLPSHSENFGQTIAESLAAGVPALVTDTLPWRALDSAGAGRCVSWENYPAALDALLGAAPEALAPLRSAARDWVLANFTWESSARRLLAFYPTLRPAA